MTHSEYHSINNIVDFIEDIFERRGADSYLGEAVTMSQHMLQAAQLAETHMQSSNNENGAVQDAIIVSALLHDIGHYTSEFPADAADQGIDNLHDKAGARVIAQWFPQLVIDCIRYHVDAKRYLCAVELAYHADLSDASRLSLKLQGGPMAKEEVLKFSAMKNLAAILQVRRWDDQAKNPDMETPPFSHYRNVLERVVAVHMESMPP